MIRAGCCLVLLLILLPVNSVTTDMLPPVRLLDASELARAQASAQAGDPDIQPALAALRQRADQALTRGPYTVTAKTVAPPSGDVHDYISLSIYWWPDPAQASGQPYLQRDGVRNPEADDASRYDANSLGRMVSDVETLSLTYFLTGEERYGGYAARLLQTWFLTPKTRMRPNFQFAQIIPGRDAIRGIGIIESRRFTAIVDSVALLEGCACWSAGDQQALRQWFAEFAAWLRTSPHGQMESRTTNNHAVWYDVQVLDFALFTGDTSLATSLADSAKERIAAQIASDGSMPRELARTRSFHYTNFNLQAFAELATLSQQVDVDLWAYQSPDSNASIRSALDFVLPYVDGTSPWPYEEIAPVNAFQETAQLLRRAAQAYPDATSYDTVLSTISADRSPLDLLRLKLGYWPA